MAESRRRAAGSEPAVKKPRQAKKPAVPVSFVSEVCSGDERRALEAMRLKLATEMDAAPAAVVAQVAARLQAVLVRLSELPDREAVSKSDDLAARRKARRAAAGMDGGAAREG